MKKHFLFFFLDDFHQGAVNRALHFIGFTLLGFALGKGDLFILILSPLVMELGHFYNYARGVHREYALKIIPVQLIGWVVFVVIGYLLARAFYS